MYNRNISKRKDIRTLNYTGLTDQEAFNIWLAECPVQYIWQNDVDDNEENIYAFYTFKVEIDYE